MKPIQGNKLRILLFSGTHKEVMLSTNRWLEEDGQMFEVVDIEYNYQGPDYDGKKLMNDGSHGVLLVTRPLTINDVRMRERLEPLSSSIEHQCTDACVYSSSGEISHAH